MAVLFKHKRIRIRGLIETESYRLRANVSYKETVRKSKIAETGSLQEKQRHSVTRVYVAQEFFRSRR